MNTRMLNHSQRIEYLVLRRFPKANLLDVPPSIGSGTRSLPDRRQLRADVEAYKGELWALPPDELAALYAAERGKEAELRRLEAEAAERARHFHQPGANADFDHWSKAAHWTLDEAIALSFGKAPERVHWDNVKPHVSASPFAFQYQRRRDLALRAIPWKQLFDPVLPGIFAAWCKRNDLSFPSELEAALTVRGNPIRDWQSLYEELEAARQKQLSEWSEFADKQRSDWEAMVQQRDESIGELQRRINELEHRPPNTGTVGEKPVGTRERDSLLKLVIGMAIGGYGFDPRATRSEQTQAIADDLVRQGIALDVDTVRKWLREGAALLPPDESAG